MPATRSFGYAASTRSSARASGWGTRHPRPRRSRARRWRTTGSMRRGGRHSGRGAKVGGAVTLPSVCRWVDTPPRCARLPSLGGVATHGDCRTRVPVKESGLSRCPRSRSGSTSREDISTSIVTPPPSGRQSTSSTVPPMPVNEPSWLPVTFRPVKPTFDPFVSSRSLSRGPFAALGGAVPPGGVGVVRGSESPRQPNEAVSRSAATRVARDDVASPGSRGVRGSRLVCQVMDHGHPNGWVVDGPCTVPRDAVTRKPALPRGAFSGGPRRGERDGGASRWTRRARGERPQREVSVEGAWRVGSRRGGGAAR